MALAKGLEGVTALISEISSIIDGKLTYRGYDIDQLAHRATFEETAFLLLRGYLPTSDELQAFGAQLNNAMSIPDRLVSMLKLYPKDARPMAMLRTAISSLAFYDEAADIITEQEALAKAISLTAKIPVILACFARMRENLEPIAPLPSLSLAANFLYMLTGEEPDEIAYRAMDQALVLHADHELNASTFAGRVTAATLADIYSSVTAAIGALKGPLHGGANEQVMIMLDQIGTMDNIEPFILGKLERKEKIMGFGHRVYKNGEDPRAKHLKEMSQKLGLSKKSTLWYDMSNSIEQLVGAHKGLKPNVDFYSASVYTYLGIPRDFFTPVFAMSRITGWTSHILEQYADNRLIRPRAEYVGLRDQVYLPIEDRVSPAL